MPMSPQAGDWAQRQHTLCIAPPMLPGANQPGLSTAAVVQQLGNVALAINRTDDDRATCEFLASQQPSTARSGFESFPTLSQRLILHASARLDCGSTRTAPVLTSYMELLGFANVAFGRTHMHTYIRSDAHNYDIFISQGLCAAVKTASFLSNFSTRPGPFSLFSCIMEPLEKSDLGGEDDSLQMKLKLQDSLEGLPDKDIRGLTKMFYVAPATFVNLRSYLPNFSGICTMVFSASHFLHCDSHQAMVRLLGQGRREGPRPPTKIGLLIECRIQSFLQHCAISTTAAEADDGLHLLAFDTFQNMLKDGINLSLQSCNTPTPALPVPPSTPSPRARHQNQQSPSRVPPPHTIITPTPSISRPRTNGRYSSKTLPPVPSSTCAACTMSTASVSLVPHALSSHVPTLGAERGRFLVWIAMCR